MKYWDSELMRKNDTSVGALRDSDGRRMGIMSDCDGYIVREHETLLRASEGLDEEEECETRGVVRTHGKG